uniref:protein-tyrosine-phosphatase n=1 Tax=Peronospora matthiolae TaxID=2874970 RepID=A0AAV1TKL1_9STRA
MGPNSPLVDLLVQRQHHHVALEAVPTAARIGDLPLFLGEARAARDVAFLTANSIQAIIALGTGDLTVKPCDVLLIDILDMEDELLLPHFDECIQFLNRFLTRQAAAVLVHCVYGQSRSATICVAYVMATQEKTLLEAYDIVQRARPCISINTGFLRQLDLFERMQKDPNWMGRTPAHAELRTIMAHQQRGKTGAAHIVGTVQLARSSSSLCCRKCTYVLCTTSNQLLHLSPGESSGGGRCAGLFIEPMTWMMKDPDFIRNSVGKLLCPSCHAKLGSWNWMGVKCNCKRFVTPAFQLVPSRIQQRVCS